MLPTTGTVVGWFLNAYNAMDCGEVAFGWDGKIGTCYKTPPEMICGQVMSVSYSASASTYTVFCYPGTACDGGGTYWPNLAASTCYSGSAGDLLNGMYLEVGASALIGATTDANATLLERAS